MTEPSAGAWIAQANYAWPFGLAGGVVVLWALLLLRFFGRPAVLPSPASVAKG